MGLVLACLLVEMQPWQSSGSGADGTVLMARRSAALPVLQAMCRLQPSLGMPACLPARLPYLITWVACCRIHMQRMAL
jgi:hypothetical protein